MASMAVEDKGTGPSNLRRFAVGFGQSSNTGFGASSNTNPSGNLFGGSTGGFGTGGGTLRVLYPLSDRSFSGHLWMELL
jgi:hypothetical protein